MVNATFLSRKVYNDYYKNLIKNVIPIKATETEINAAQKMTNHVKCHRGIIYIKFWLFLVTSLACMGVNGQHKNQQLIDSVACYICESDIVHKEIVMKQVILESGWCKGEFLMSRNNLFGFRAKNYLRFKNWQESVDYYLKWQRKRYINIDEDYYRFLERVKYGAPGYSGKLRKVRYDLKCPCNR